MNVTTKLYIAIFSFIFLWGCSLQVGVFASQPDTVSDDSMLIKLK